MSYNVYKTNMADCLNKLRVYDLNQLCRKFLLPQHGKKVAIVERILEYITDVEREEQIYEFILAIKPSIFDIINGKRINSTLNNSNINNTQNKVHNGPYSNVHNSTHSNNSGSNKYLSSCNNFCLDNNNGNNIFFCNNNDNLKYANNEILAAKKSNTSSIARKGKAVKIYQEDSDFSSCVCGGMSKNISSKNGIVKCIECNKLQHVSCYMQNTCINKDTNNYKILCVICRLKDMDPFYPMKKVLWMKSLTVNSEKLVINASDIKNWKNENKEVIIFCVNIDKKNLSSNISIKQEWPKTFVLKINGNIIEKVFEPSWEHKRRDSPLKITHTLKVGQNNIDINMTNYEIPKLFVVAFLLCKIETEQSIIQNVISNSSLNFKDSKERIITILSTKHDDDEVMCMEVNRRISLNCPFALDRIVIPCRGIKCCHIQCFDLKSFIDVTKKTKAFNNRWKCPICSLYLRPKDLVIDMFITYILTQVPDDIKEVELSKSGEIIFNQKCVEGKVIKQIDDADTDHLQKSKVEIKTESCTDNMNEYPRIKEDSFNRNEIIIVDSDPEDNNTSTAYQNVSVQKNYNTVQDQQEVICISDSEDEDNFNCTAYNSDKKTKEKGALLIEMKKFESNKSINDFFIRNMKNLEKRRNLVPNSRMLFNDMVLDVLNDINNIRVNENISTCNIQNFDTIQKERIAKFNRNFNDIANNPLLSYYNKANILSKDLYFLNTSLDSLNMDPINNIISYTDSVDRVDCPDHGDKNNLQASEFSTNDIKADTCEKKVNNRDGNDNKGEDNVDHANEKDDQTCAKEDHIDGKEENQINGENHQRIGKGDQINVIDDQLICRNGKMDNKNHEASDNIGSDNFIGLDSLLPYDIQKINETDVLNKTNQNYVIQHNKEEQIPSMKENESSDENKSNFHLKVEENISLIDKDVLVNNELPRCNDFDASRELYSELKNPLQEQNIPPCSLNNSFIHDTQNRSKKKKKRKKSNSPEHLRKYDSINSNFNLSVTNYKNKRDRAKQLKYYNNKQQNFNSIHIMNKADDFINRGRHVKKINKKNDNFKNKKKKKKEKKKETSIRNL